MIAADLPSGLDANRGVPGEADPALVRAEVTVTFVAPKAGFTAAAEPWLGRVVVADIGLPDAAVAKFLAASHGGGQI